MDSIASLFVVVMVNTDDRRRMQTTEDGQCQGVWHKLPTGELKILILSCLNDFITCSGCFNIQSGGVHISALEHCRKIKFSIYVHQTLMYTV